MHKSDAIRLIKERLSLVDIARRYVDLKPNGSRYVAPCPFHQETKPSFSINPERGFFYCFGCHASGDLFEFYGRINGLDFRESLEQLAAEAGVTLDARFKAGDNSASLYSRVDIQRINEIAAKHFQGALKGASGAQCREYVARRGLSREMVENFCLGWAENGWHSLANVLHKNGFDPDLCCEAGLLGKSASGNVYDRFRGRLMFPIRDSGNRIIAFGGRIIEKSDEAKYINSPDTPLYNKKDHLYGLAQARGAISSKGFAYLTEGYMDVLTLHQFGFDNGVGVLGTALTPEQIKRLTGFTSRVTLVFDGDSAGRKAAFRSARMLLARGLACQVILLPPDEDIDSLLHGRGKEAFAQLEVRAPDGLTFCVDVARKMAPREAVEWARGFLGEVEVDELVSPYASRLANLLRISEKELRDGLVSRRGSFNSPSPQMRHLLNMRDTQIMIYAVRYPHRLPDLRSLGADLVLASPRAKDFWDILCQWHPDEVFNHLDEKQKNFWLLHRGPTVAPLTDGDFELACLEKDLAAFYNSAQKASLSAALGERGANEDFKTELEYLRALQETMGERS